MVAPIALAAFLLGAAAPPPRRPPVVLLVSLDTFRADRLAAYGGPASLMPETARIFGGAARFDRCVTPAPITLPAHATLLTSEFPETTGLHDNGRGVLAATLPTLAEAFRKGGYETRAVVASVVLEGRYGLERGFDVYDDRFGPTLRRDAGEVVDAALAAIRTRRKPLFLWLHFYDCHEPYDPPQRFREKFPTSRYDAAAAALDAELGRLAGGLPPGSVVALVADHGEALGEHGEETHGILLFQSTLRVPFLLLAPGAKAGASDASCSLADVAPTLSAAAGLRFGGSGRDLLAADLRPARPIPLETWLPFDEFRWKPLVGATDGRWKWIRGTATRLYDLETDPGETNDLSADAPGEARRMREAIPRLPKLAPETPAADPSLRSLGYLSAGSSGEELAPLPDPHDRVGILRRFDEGRARNAAGEPKDALEIFRAAAKDDPGNPSAWFELGETARRLGLSAEASSALDRAIRLAPSMAVAWLSRGFLWLGAGRSDLAAQCFAETLRRNPTMIDALNAMAAYHLETGAPGEAMPLLDRALGRGIANSETYYLLGRIALVEKRSDVAREYFAKAFESSNSLPDTLKAVADAYQVAGHPVDAERLYEEALRRFPTYVPARLTFGSLLAESGRYRRAAEVLRGALALELSPADRANVEALLPDLEEAATTVP